MKKIIVFSAAILMLSLSAHAQTTAALHSQIKLDKKVEGMIDKEKKTDRKEIKKLEGTEVSYQAKQAFMADFGKLPAASWSKLNNFDKVTFKKEGKLESAFYDADAKLVGTTQIKTFADLPAKGKASIHKYYKDYTAGNVLFFDDNEMNETDMILFGNQFADKDSYFVELAKGNKKIVVQVAMDGGVTYFARIK